MKEPDDLIAKAVQLLSKGELVAFPTETVYGLGADASSKAALQKLYETKGRPASHPVIVHIGAIEQLESFAVDIPASAFKLAESFWPGPLTLILKRASHVLDEVTGGQETVGVRMPNHPLALELLRAFAGGVAAPSANRFGRVSPTRAIDVASEFGAAVSLILDGGACQVGIESTIVDMTVAQPVILRPGMIQRNELAEAAGETILARECRVKQPATTRAPGGLPSHYAPDTAVELLASADRLHERLSELESAGMRVAVLSFGEARPGNGSRDTTGKSDERVAWVVGDSSPDLYARQLYANLRYLDQLACDRILIERPPAAPEWAGIEDRLIRAAAARSEN